MQFNMTEMIIPVSKETFFNTKWTRAQGPLCAYDMLYHPPDYNPKALRSDRMEPQIIRRNIWEQEKLKLISSTTHFMYGRPAWPILDKTLKQFVRRTTMNENPHTRIYNVLEWAVLLDNGKPSTCQ